MVKNIALCLCLLLLCVSSSARKVIGDLNFQSGEWALIGVPMHNYHMLPIQRELSTFISKDLNFMRELQSSWDLDITFEDKCDYHYALKFYNNGKLVRTLLLNLHCGYISDDGLAYEFNPREFEKFRSHSQPIAWSRISFGDLGQLKKAIQTLNNTPDVYWYEDVQQYTYPGFLMLSVNRLPWNADQDSLYDAIHAMVRYQINSSDFYLQKYHYTIQGDYLYVRYIVNCAPMLARRVRGNSYSFPNTSWRSHLYNRDSVNVVAIGINQRSYKNLMKRRHNYR